MEFFEKLGNNPLYVSLITLIATSVIGAIGYLLKKRIDGDTKEHKSSDVGTNNQTNNIIQNFNSGITYKEARQIAEEVVEDRLSTINNRKNKK